MATLDFSSVLRSVTLPGGNSWRNGARQLTKSLPRFLSWEMTTSLIGECAKLYQTWIDHRLATWVRSSGINFTDRIRALPLEYQRRLFSAPQFFVLLRGAKVPDTERIEQLNTYIAIEEYLCGLSEKAPGGSYSALGDFKISAEADQPLGPLATPNTTRLGGLLIDSGSPYIKSTWINPSLGDGEEHTAEEFANLCQDIERAFQHVDSVSPAAAEMIRSCVSVIVVAKGSKDQESQSSMSARRMIGCMTLANLHSIQQFDPAADVEPAARISDSLVHEAIHSLIYRIELFDSFYTDEGQLFSAKIISPWSGRELTLHSFVHACFVWFGLRNFWRVSAKHDRPCPHLAERAETGFLRGNLSDILTPDKAALVEPHVYYVLDWMFEAVKAGNVQ